MARSARPSLIPYYETRDPFTFGLMTEDRGAQSGVGWEALREALAERGLNLEREIGRGGMARVYQAYDLKHDRPVAIKVLQTETALGAERLLREIRLVSPLAHPHIVPVYDSGQVAGAPYFVMPLIEGETLRARLRRSGPLPVVEAVQIAHNVADALTYAHARGVIHRDIKPENILLHAGHALLADFGVAVAQADTGVGRADRLTDAGVAVGTAEYMSPEQALGEGAVDGRSDLYGLGCVLYEMLVGKAPFGGGSVREIVARRFQAPPPSVRRERPEVPPALERVVATALAVDPAERFSTASEMTRALTGETPLPRRRWGWAGRRSWPAWSLALAAAGLLLWFWPHGRVPRFDPRRVVVGTFSNETAQDSLNYLGIVTSERIRLAVARTRDAIVATSSTVLPSQVDSGLVRDTLDDPQRVRALAAEMDAGLVVSGSYYRDAGAISFLCEITDANQGRLVQAIGPIHAPIGRPERAVDSLSVAVAAAIESVVHPPPVKPRQ